MTTTTLPHRVPRPGATRSRSTDATRRRAATVADLLGWSLLTVALCLAGWIVATAVLFGWRPVVIDGDSMTPTLRRGDVVMVERVSADGPLAPGTVVTFRSGAGGLVTHRIVSTDTEGAFVTRGDGNRNEDAGRVVADDVVGVGRLVVPAIGTPVLWIRQGDRWPLLAVAFSAATFALLQVRRRRGDHAGRRRT